MTDVDVASAIETASAIEGAEAHALDVTDPMSSQTLVDSIVAQHRRLDVWVSNAGISKMQNFIDVSPVDLRRTFDVNTYGVSTADKRRHAP